MTDCERKPCDLSSTRIYGDGIHNQCILPEYCMFTNWMFRHFNYYPTSLYGNHTISDYNL